jgi:hypothetical protein
MLGDEIPTGPKLGSALNLRGYFFFCRVEFTSAMQHEVCLGGQRPSKLNEARCI